MILAILSYSSVFLSTNFWGFYRDFEEFASERSAFLFVKLPTNFLFDE